VGGVFINYRGTDTKAYGALAYTALAQRFGGDLVFLDSESIGPGDDFEYRILGQVRRSAVLLALIGPDWLLTGAAGVRRIDDPKDWIRRELKAAFTTGAIVIPVLTDGATMPGPSDLPADIAKLSRCQYRHLRHREATHDLARLAAELEEADAGLRAAARLRAAALADRPATTADIGGHGTVIQHSTVRDVNVNVRDVPPPGSRRPQR
jgi:hypothetical protein